MQIFAAFLDGNKLTLDVEPNITIEDVKKQIQRMKGIHPDDQRIIYAGKQTRDEGTLSHYRIDRESTLHVILKLRNTAQPPAVAVFPTDDGAKKTSREWKTVADRGDFDEDLHIVDPQVHFHLLKQLEREVVERSEFFEKKGQYSFDQGLDPDSIQNLRANIANVPAWLRSKVENNMQIWKVRYVSLSDSSESQYLVNDGQPQGMPRVTNMQAEVAEFVPMVDSKASIKRSVCT